jgi:hypothetical protein
MPFIELEELDKFGQEAYYDGNRVFDLGNVEKMCQYFPYCLIQVLFGYQQYLIHQFVMSLGQIR